MANPIILKTERLVLRPPLPDDAPQIVERIGVKDIAWNMARVPYPYQDADAAQWLERVPQAWAEDTSYSFAITLAEFGLIGGVNLRQMPMDIWEVGYWLGKPWWGHGYATEAALAVMDWAASYQKLTQFSSGHFTDNPESGRVLRKLGFEPVGETELFGKARGQKAPCIRYSRGADPELALRLAAH